MHFTVEPGTVLQSSSGNHVIVLRVISATTVEVRDLETSQDRQVAIDELQPRMRTKRTARVLDAVSDDSLDVVHEQYLAIEPFLDQARMQNSQLSATAIALGVSTSTIRRWIKKFREQPVVTSLLRQGRSDKGTRKLPEAVEKIVSATIKARYLTTQQRSVHRCYRDIGSICRRKGLPSPSYGSVRSRILAVDPYLATKSRLGENKALKKRATRGSVPDADYPYALLQIDHTQVDVVLVDDVHRLPLGKPWLTLAIDVFSRMAAGVYIAFETPGMIGTGLCITNAMLGKKELLRRLGLDDVSYPCQGKPAAIHVDNAREFRGRDLERACLQHGINLRFRRIKKPQYGAHIERMMGTLAREIAALPGTTFGDHRRREAYDSEAKAAMTLSEFEVWLGNLLYRSYHHRTHSGIGMPPIKKYSDGFLGSDSEPGIGRITLAADPNQLRLDFMPSIERSIQTEGVVADKIQYYDDVLRRWVGARDPMNLRQARMFTFKRDPRDISRIWFLDPDLGEYFPIGYRKREYPPISLWELRAIQTFLRGKGREAEDEEQIFRGYDEMLRIEESSIKTTKAARLAAGKRKARKEKVASEGVAHKKRGDSLHGVDTMIATDDETVVAGNTFSEIVRR